MINDICPRHSGFAPKRYKSNEVTARRSANAPGSGYIRDERPLFCVRNPRPPPRLPLHRRTNYVLMGRANQNYSDVCWCSGACSSTYPVLPSFVLDSIRISIWKARLPRQNLDGSAKLISNRGSRVTRAVTEIHSNQPTLGYI